ncbi:unnamed protein product [marine sediment metagenome]|uniref:Uncharacterized protein n=1 Tax=marine sediment metagenome TaxID=412755 RepID=X1SW44_9ZZZZ
MIKFLVGQRYRNRKGKYEILEIKNDQMKVRYDDGQEQMLALSIQAPQISSILSATGKNLWVVHRYI